MTTANANGSRDRSGYAHRDQGCLKEGCIACLRKIIEEELRREFQAQPKEGAS